jgi:hypothetical protein
MTYLAVLVEVKPDVYQEMPDAITKVLEEYANIMPSELPKELLLKRVTNHKIGLILGTLPLA